MNARERGILLGLAVLLAAGIVFIVAFRGGGGDDDDAETPPVSPEGWDISRLPNLGTPVREFQTPGGVLVQVIEEGRGDPVGKGQAMDIDYTAYLTDRRSPVGRGVFRHMFLRRTKHFPGLVEGLAEMRPFERRRLLIPGAMAYGSRRVGDIPPNADVIFDVQWTRLVVKDIKKGTGKPARLNTKVVVHYRGTFEDGKEFDSSHRKGDPVAFRLRRGGLIDGWIQGIPGMREGGIRKLWVPWHLAYQESGRPSSGIPPYSNLVFVVELIAVQ